MRAGRRQPGGFTSRRRLVLLLLEAVQWSESESESLPEQWVDGEVAGEALHG